MLDTTRYAQYLPQLSIEYNIRNYFQNLHLRAQSAFISLQNMPHYPLKFNQVPELLVEPYIINGFRSMHQPWSYYWKSLFHKHNETINVWSHLSGILYMTYLFVYYYNHLNFFENSHSWPFAVSICAAIMMFFCSAGAHLFHSKSESVHVTCFLIDYIGVSLHGFGSGFLHIYYSAPEWYYKRIQYHYVFFLLMWGFLACFLNCFSICYYQRPYPAIKRFWQFFPCGILWIYSIVPLCIRLYSSNFVLTPPLMCHLAQILLFLLGAFLFASDIPQRFWPGAVDFIGQGHHLFHTCIYIATICQMHGVYWDYQDHQYMINQRNKPDLIICAGSIVTLIGLDLFAVYLFRLKIFEKCHKH